MNFKRIWIRNICCSYQSTGKSPLGYTPGFPCHKYTCIISRETWSNRYSNSSVVITSCGGRPLRRKSGSIGRRGTSDCSTSSCRPKICTSRGSRTLRSWSCSDSQRTRRARLRQSTTQPITAIGEKRPRKKVHMKKIKFFLWNINNMC